MEITVKNEISHLEKIMQATDRNKQKSTEWLNARQNFLTSSDLGSVLNLNKYRSREEVLSYKAGLTEHHIDCTDAIDHGNRYEDEAISVYCKLTGRESREVGLVSYASMHEGDTTVDGIDCSFLAGSADGVTFVPGREAETLNMLEVKAPYRRWPKYGTVPEYYYPQVQMNLHILNVPYGDFIEYWPKGFQGKDAKMNIVRIYKDDFWFRHVLPDLRSFWDDVLELRNGKKGGTGTETNPENSEEAFVERKQKKRRER